MISETTPKQCETSEFLDMCILVFAASMRSMGVPANLILMAHNHASLMVTRYTHCMEQVEKEQEPERRKEIMHEMKVYTLDPLTYMQTIIEECITLRYINREVSTATLDPIVYLCSML